VALRPFAPVRPQTCKRTGGLFLRRIFVLVLVLAAAPIALVRASSTPAADSSESANASAFRYLGSKLRRFQQETWRWQRVMGVPLTKRHGRVLAALSLEDAEDAVDLWRRRASGARERAQHPPNLRTWLCIHRFEARWDDPYAPYYGGLQMDLVFQRHYGSVLLRRKGTADRWTPLEQIWVAERARRSGRGFWPWPRTARLCGVL
jgi:hypothetical protein